MTKITDQDFDTWNEQKKEIHKKESGLYFKEGDIWRVSLGVNVRSESYGKGDHFRRPVLVIKKLSADMCIAIPLSSKEKQGTRFAPYSLHGTPGTAMLYQIRTIHKNRFQRKIGEISPNDFGEIQKRLRKLLNL